jgi:hypothetical protein
MNSAGYSQSTQAFSAMLVESIRHSKTSSSIGVYSSAPMYVTLMLRLFVWTPGVPGSTSAGVSTIHVSGAPGTTPSSQTTPKHCSSSMLPAAKLPPPSMPPTE